MSAILGALAISWEPSIFIGLPLVIVIALVVFLVVRSGKSK